MLALNSIIPIIRKLLTTVASSHNIDAAVFDGNFRLLTCTDKYLKHKGRMVHTPFLQDAFIQDNLLVNKPGCMPACVGCRFKDHCPATIEILHAIRISDQPIGVVAFTSFTIEGQRRITKNLDLHLENLHNLADLIGTIIQVHPTSCTEILPKNIPAFNPRNALDDIQGNSEIIKSLKAKIKQIANSTSTVLITGETGSGKEVFAKAIHNSSLRSTFPFIAINCASIPENLLESELFGYEEGAFTGAKRSGKPGYFELAHRGTVFLDEIGDMPMYMQAKLLRVIQDRTILRVGGTRPIQVDIRVIAATNQNLDELILAKQFRSDLYYRLNVIPFSLPPLRMRKEDIETLSIHFLKQYTLLLHKNIPVFTTDVMNSLKAYNWPGNVRELENIIEHAVNMETTSVITLNSLPVYFLAQQKLTVQQMKEKIANVEINAIKAALDKHGWDLKGKSQAAKELGIGVRTLYRKLQNLTQ